LVRCTHSHCRDLKRPGSLEALPCAQWLPQCLCDLNPRSARRKSQNRVWDPPQISGLLGTVRQRGQERAGPAVPGDHEQVPSSSDRDK
jgi:hypothetical protein